MRLTFVLLFVVALITVALAGGRGRGGRRGGGRRRGGDHSSSSHLSESSESRDRGTEPTPRGQSSEISSSEESRGRYDGSTSRSRGRGGRGRGYRPRGGPRGRTGRPRRPTRPIWPVRNPRGRSPSVYACQLKNESSVIKSRGCPTNKNSTIFCSSEKLNVTFQNRSAIFTFCNYTVANKRTPNYKSILIKRACHVTKLNANGVKLNTRRASCRCLRRKHSECSGGPIIIPLFRRWKLSLLFCKKRNETFDPLTIFGRDNDDEIDEPVDGNPDSDDGNPGPDGGNQGTDGSNPGTDGSNPGTVDGNQGTGDGNPGTGDNNQVSIDGNTGTDNEHPGTTDGNPGTGDNNQMNTDGNPGTGDSNVGTGDVAIIDDITGNNNGNAGSDGGDVAISN